MTRRSIVMIPGAQHGGWAFRRVLAPLRDLGVEPHAVTLTGLGERAHLLTDDVDLNTHVQDVVALVEMEGLADTELTILGHSYGGMVAAGAAARLGRAHAGGAVDRIVYLDSPVPFDGDSSISIHPTGAEFLRRRIEVGGVGVMPRSTGEALGLTPDDLAWVAPRLTPQPFRCLDTPLSLPAGWDADLERVYLECTEAFPGRERPYLDRVRPDEGWQLHRLPTGHDPMISDPDRLMAVLGDLLLSAPKVVTTR